MSAPSRELPLSPEPEKPASIAVETEVEVLATNSPSENRVSTLEEEERHVLPSSDDMELNEETIPPVIAEPGPEDVAAVVATASEALDLQAQHSVEETTEVNFTLVSSAGSVC
jgi:hypothetical protein